MLLALALASGLTVRARTRAVGDRNRADVWVAELVADTVGIEHTVQAADPQAPERPLSADELLRRTIGNLHRSDGMLSTHYGVSRRPDPRREVGLTGLGGEILRGGYGERAVGFTPARMAHFVDLMFTGRPELLTEAVVAEMRARRAQWVDAARGDVPIEDVLECLWMRQRVARLGSATIWGSRNVIAPYLDNRASVLALSCPVAAKRNHRIYVELLEELRPELAELPVANKHWGSTPVAERRRLERAYPEAYVPPVRSSPPDGTSRAERVAAMTAYVLAGRLELLADVVHVDRARELLAEGSFETPGELHALNGLYAASVLLTEDWTRG